MRLEEQVALLRQRSRPYLFSNSIAPPVAGATMTALDLIERSGDLRQALRRNTSHFRARMTELGFDILPGDHPIVPVMIGDAALAGRMADALIRRGVYAVAFSYPVVPQGKARIRTIMTATHTREELDQALDTLKRVGKRMGIV